MNAQPMPSRQAQVTQMLQAGNGNGQLLPLVYDELRMIANRRMTGERASHTLQATALVHEAYMKLVGREEVSWRNRKHFYSAAAQAMRHILIDHARRSKSQKRGGGQKKVTLGAHEMQMELDPEQLLSLNEAFDRLEKEDEAAAAVTRMRFFSGLSVQETAQALEISERSVHRKWTYARARLFEMLEEG